MTSNTILGKDLKVGDLVKIYKGYAEITEYQYENNWTIRITVLLVREGQELKEQRWITTANTPHTLYGTSGDILEQDYSRFSLFRGYK